MAIFKGAGVALITPMNEDGSVKYEVLSQLIDYQIDNGTDAIIACGTTGEASSLTDDEYMEVLRFCVNHIKHRVPVIAGTGSNNTNRAIRLTQEAEKNGVDGCLMVTPYYNKTTQKGLYENYRTIARETKLPCILYNVPSRTGINILPETVARLFYDVDNIIGIKEASGDINQVCKVAELTNGDIDIYSGNDDQIVPICSLGGIGVISVMSNVAPQEVHDLMTLCMKGDYIAARTKQFRANKLIRELFSEVNPIPVKAALRMQGFDVGIPRLPLVDIEEQHKQNLKDAMKEFGCLN